MRLLNMKSKTWDKYCVHVQVTIKAAASRSSAWTQTARTPQKGRRWFMSMLKVKNLFLQSQTVQVKLQLSVFNLKFVSVSTLRSAGTRRAAPWSWRWSWRTRRVNAVISTLTESFTGLSGTDHQPSLTYFTSHPTFTGAFLPEHFTPMGAGTCSAWPAWAWINHTTWWRVRRSSGLQLN